MLCVKCSLSFLQKVTCAPGVRTPGPQSLVREAHTVLPDGPGLLTAQQTIVCDAVSLIELVFWWTSHLYKFYNRFYNLQFSKSLYL